MIKQYSGDQSIVVNILQDKAETLGDKVFIQHRDTEVSYADINETANRIGNGLSSTGVNKGDRVLIMFPNGIEILYCWFGTSKIGGVEVPVNFNLKGNTLLHIINDSGAKIMMIHQDYLNRLDDIKDKTIDLQTLVVFGDLPSGNALSSRYKIIPFDDMMNADSETPGVALKISDPATIMYTSGTTGPPKGVVQPHGFPYCYCYPSSTSTPTLNGGMTDSFIHEGDILYSYLPMYHTAAKYVEVVGTMVANSKLVIAESLHPATFWDDVSKHNATFCYALFAAAFLYMMPPKPNDAENTLERFLCIPLIPEINDFAKRFGVEVFTAYGLSEGGSIFCGKIPEDLKDTSFMGAGRDDFDICLIDDEGNKVLEENAGEVCMRPKKPFTTMLGYHNQPEKTLEAWKDLWLHTGDMARMDKQGYFYYAGRLKERIRRRGENISPESIEQEIYAHPDVMACAAVPVDSDFDMAGENEILAVVVLNEGKQLKHEDLIAFLEPKLPYFMIPRYIKFAAELPRTPTNKVKRVLLQDNWSDGDVWDLSKSGIKLKK